MSEQPKPPRGSVDPATTLFPDRVDLTPRERPPRRVAKRTFACCEKEMTKPWAVLHQFAHSRVAFSTRQLSEAAGVPMTAAADMTTRALLDHAWIREVTEGDPLPGVGQLWLGELERR